MKIKKRKTKKDNNKEIFIKLKAEGKSISTIADRLKVTRKTIYEWEDRYKDEIALAKHNRISKLNDQYMIDYEEELRRYKELEELTFTQAKEKIPEMSAADALKFHFICKEKRYELLKIPEPPPPEEVILAPNQILSELTNKIIDVKNNKNNKKRLVTDGKKRKK